MIYDLQSDSPVSLCADVCIVGAGAAGIALAVELARRGKRVLLLEGGGSNLKDETQEPYRSEIAGLPHRGVHDGRFRVHGGTTTQWGGQILELDELDFADRSWIPQSGWPFAKSELIPFYSRALELEGVDRSILNDEDVWRTLGETRSSLADMDTYLSRWCPEPNFARLHKSALEGPSVDVWLHATAVELLLDGTRAVGIRTCTQNGKQAVFKADEYVFCLGAIESSRFFLQPRSGQLPWNSSGLLGCHFQDHIDCNAATVIPRSRREWQRRFDSIFLRGFKYQPKIKLSARTTQDERILNTAASMASESESAEALAGTRTAAKHLLGGRFRELRAAHLAGIVRHSPSFLQQTYRYVAKSRSYQPPDAVISLRVHCEQEPTSRSRITLSGQRDSLGLLRTKLSWTISPLELQSIRRFVAHAQSAFDSIAKVIPSPALSSDAALIERSQDSFHHMGGMRMHAAPSHGVVTPDLRLHGIDNAYVCSSAVFPTSGFSNPTHTLIALAVRLARHLTAH